MDKSSWNDSSKERLLAYAAGILSSMVANPNHQPFVSDFDIKSSIRKASLLINCVFDDNVLMEILNEDPNGKLVTMPTVGMRDSSK